MTHEEIDTLRTQVETAKREFDEQLKDSEAVEAFIDTLRSDVLKLWLQTALNHWQQFEKNNNAKKIDYFQNAIAEQMASNPGPSN